MSLKKIVAYHLIAFLVGSGLIAFYSYLTQPPPTYVAGYGKVGDLGHGFFTIFLLFSNLTLCFVSLIIFILFNQLNKAHEIGNSIATNQNLISNNIMNWQRVALFTTVVSILTVFPGLLFINNALIPVVVAITNFIVAVGLGIKDKSKKLLPIFSLLMSATVIVAAYYRFAVIAQH